MADGDDEEGGARRGPTPLAAEVERLRQATVAAAGKREHLPQPLFWSLFRSEVDRLKRQKAVRRALEEVFGEPRE